MLFEKIFIRNKPIFTLLQTIIINFLLFYVWYKITKLFFFDNFEILILISSTLFIVPVLLEDYFVSKKSIDKQRRWHKVISISIAYISIFIIAATASVIHNPTTIPFYILLTALPVFFYLKLVEEPLLKSIISMFVRYILIISGINFLMYLLSFGVRGEGGMIFIFIYPPLVIIGLIVNTVYSILSIRNSYYKIKDI